LAAESVNRGQGLAFTCELLDLIWSGSVVGWDQGAHLAHCAERSGLDLAELDAAATEKAEELDAQIFQNQDDLQAAGHWYTPSFVFDDNLLFGDSRADLALSLMMKAGLKRRAVT